MNITPQLIKQLRDETGAGFMDCKQALEKAAGDLEQAKVILREKGAVIATRRAGKETNQGLIGARVSEDRQVGVLIDLRCETDFVARNEEFRQLAEELLSHLLAFGQEISLESLSEQPLAHDPSLTFGKRIELTMGKVGERLELNRYAVVRVDEGGRGVVDAYIHHNGRVGTLVAITGSSDPETLRALAHEVAIQIAWSAPEYLTRDQVPPERLQQELEIEKQRALNEGRPEKAAEQIARGRVEKNFIRRACLLEQPYYRDDTMTIGNLLQQRDATARVKRFMRFEVGE